MATLFKWQFIEVQNLTGHYWIWQRIAIDGSINDRCAIEFADYGAAVHNAISNADFSPQTEGWSIITLRGVSHYSPGKTSREAKSGTGKLPRKKLKPGRKSREPAG
jgi:hypothetical protein